MDFLDTDDRPGDTFGDVATRKAKSRKQMEALLDHLGERADSVTGVTAELDGSDRVRVELTKVAFLSLEEFSAIVSPA